MTFDYALRKEYGRGINSFRFALFQIWELHGKWIELCQLSYAFEKNIISFVL